MKRLIIFIIIGAIAFSGCYYDIEEELYGTKPCDTTTPVTYSQTITGLLSQYGCNSCHGGNAPSGNVKLDTYTGVKTVATNGKLLGAVSHAAGFSPMPQGGNKLSDCDVNKIKTWIDAGALQN